MSTAISDVRSLQTFVAIVEEGSVTRAAARLGSAKSHVSSQLARLEADLGTRLLNRTTRRISLTQAGAAFFERVQGVLAGIEEAEQEVTQLTAEPRGILRVGAPMSFGTRYLGDVVARFMERHASVSVEMTLTDRRVDLIEERLDVVVRIGALDDSSLVARRLCETRMRLVASPDYLALRGRPRTPGDLRGHDLLVYDYGPDRTRWRFEGPGGETSIDVTGRLRANNGDVLVSAALAGRGIARLPDFLCSEKIDRGGLVSLCEEWGESSLGVWALYPPTRFPSAKVRAFVDELVGYFAQSPS